MDPEEGIETPTTIDTAAGGDSPEVPGTEQQPTGGNPAFEPIRSELGDLAYSRIKSHLEAFDSNNNKRFEKIQNDTKWASDLSKQGVTPQQVAASLGLMQQIDADPVAVYQQLGKWLQENGRMPQTQQELEEALDTDDEDGEQQFRDPRYDQLAEQNERMMTFLQMEAQKEQARQADADLDAEIDALKTAHPELAREDIGEILQRAFTKTQMSGKQVPLEAAAQEYLGLRNRILSTPRPGDSAPRLVPTQGGSSAAAGPRKFSELSRDETQDLIAGLISRDNSRG